MSIRGRKGMTPQRAERAAKVLRMREAGVTFNAIAQRLDISVATAHDDFTRAIQETFREPAETMIRLEGERLDRLQAAHWEKAIVEKDVKAANVVLKIMERRARLFGLDTIKHEIGGEVLDAILTSMQVIEDTPLDDLIDAEE